MFRDDLLLDFLGHFLVVREAFAVFASTASEGAEVGGVGMHNALRNLGFDNLEGPIGFHAEDVAAT